MNQKKTTRRDWTSFSKQVHGPSHPTAVEDGVEEKHEEVVKCLQELKDTALRMSKILGDISMFTGKSPPLWPPPLLFLPGDYDDGAASDVDQHYDDNVGRESLKRRRISDNLDGRIGGSAPSTPTQQEELDKF
jgi:hypothetical protein